MSRAETDIVIVGSGAGGATLAKELSQSAKQVTLVEQGTLQPQNKLGSEIFAYGFYEKHGLLSRTEEGVFYYRTIMAGGTTVVSCANGIRCLEKELQELGIDLREEFLEAEEELGIKPVPDGFIREGTKKIMQAADALGYRMQPMPKFIDFKRCTSCGNCVLGCNSGAKWSAAKSCLEAKQKGVSLIEGLTIDRVLFEDGCAIGVEGHNLKGEKTQITARIVVLAAGGIGTPIILQNSAIAAGNKLFLDLFTVTMGLTSSIGMASEIPMAAVHRNQGFILSPLIDTPLVLASVIPTTLRHGFNMSQRNHLLGIMTKIQDDSIGRVNASGKVQKTVTEQDAAKLEQGMQISEEILIKSGVEPQTIMKTKVRGAHPGATAAIGEVVDTNLQTKIKQLFVCDSSVLPVSPGLPPILTIVALGKRLSRHLRTI